MMWRTEASERTRSGIMEIRDTTVPKTLNAATISSLEKGGMLDSVHFTAIVSK